MIFRGGRQRFLDRFEPSGAAFVYRKTISSPGVIVSADERENLVEQYEDRHVLFMLYLLADLPVTIGVTALAYAVDPSHKAYPVVAWLTLLFSPTIFAIWSESGPNKLIKDRPIIDSGPTPKVIEKRAIERSSWGALTWNVMFPAIWALSIALDRSSPLILRIVAGIIAALAFIFAVKEADAKSGYARANRRSD